MIYNFSVLSDLLFHCISRFTILHYCVKRFTIYLTIKLYYVFYILLNISFCEVINAIYLFIIHFLCFVFNVLSELKNLGCLVNL